MKYDVIITARLQKDEIPLLRERSITIHVDAPDPDAAVTEVESAIQELIDLGDEPAGLLGEK